MDAWLSLQLSRTSRVPDRGSAARPGCWSKARVKGPGGLFTLALEPSGPAGQRTRGDRGTNRDWLGSLLAPPRAPPGAGHPPSPTPAGPHVVDDHGLVGDDVVGLHGRAGPALPSRRAARRTGGLADGDSCDSRREAAPLPLNAQPTRARRGFPEGSPRPIRAPTRPD